MIAGIVLAAGLSRRMGRAKLLLDWGGAPVIRRAVEQVLAGGVHELVVVVGREAPAVREALAGLPIRFVENPAPEAGQASSIACGVSALGPAISAALIALGDQPALPSEVIPRLLQTFHETGKAIVAPLYRGTQGNPVLFAAAVFPELRTLTGDRGARSVVEKDPSRVAPVPFDLPMPADLDTLEDYERLRPRTKPV
ncbi:MAG: nucleotidyltransferase family protein [Candidatus Rokubacteria bacterium]|nr:nucleotidyltransferase family protein [Candidatus Rokubacteria bacterium]